MNIARAREALLAPAALGAVVALTGCITFTLRRDIKGVQPLFVESPDDVNTALGESRASTSKVVLSSSINW